MALGILCMHSGIDMKMYTTGEEPTFKEAGVCMLGWLIASLVLLFIIYVIRFRSKRKKCVSKKNYAEYDTNKEKISPTPKFSTGFLYILECMGLGILCAFRGADKKLYSTGSKVTRQEVAICLFSWFILSLIVVSIVLICIGN